MTQPVPEALTEQPVEAPAEEAPPQPIVGVKAMASLPADQLTEAFKAGALQFHADERVPVRLANGELGSVDAKDAQGVVDSGGSLVHPDEYHHAELEAKYGGGGGTLGAFGAGAARGLTVGLSDPLALGLAGAFGGDEAKESLRERLEAYKELHPTASTVGEIAGVAAPALLSGGAAGVAEGAVEGAGALARGASLARSGLRGAGLAAEGVGLAGRGAERLATRALGEEATSLIGRAAQSAVKHGASGAVEGALYGAGQEVSESSLGDTDLTAEKLLSSVGHGALLGGVLGGGIGAGATIGKAGVDAAVLKASPYLKTKAEEEAFRSLNGRVKFTREAEKVPGGTRAIGRDLLDSGVLQPGDTVETIAPKVQALAEKRFGAIESLVESAGDTSVSLDDVIKRLEARARSFDSQLGQEAAANAVRQQITNIRRVFTPGGRTAMEKIESLRTPRLPKEPPMVNPKLAGKDAIHRIDVDADAGLRTAADETEKPFKFSTYRAPAPLDLGRGVAEQTEEQLEELRGGEPLPKPFTIGGPTPKTPIDKAIAKADEVGVANGNYMRDGMRDMSTMRGAFEGATPEEANAIARGEMPARNSGKELPPVKVTVDDGEVHLSDGRHRLFAAQEAGATEIRANVVTYNAAGKKVERDAILSIGGRPKAVGIDPGMLEGADVGAGPIALRREFKVGINPRMLEGAEIGTSPISVGLDEAATKAAREAPINANRTARLDTYADQLAEYENRLAAHDARVAAIDPKNVRVPLKDLLGQRRMLESTTDWMNEGKVATNGKRAVGRTMEDIIVESMPAKLGEEYKAAKLAWRRAKIASDAVTDSISRAESNAAHSLTDKILGAHGMTIGAMHGPLGAIAGLGAQQASKFVRTRANAALAVWFDRLSAIQAIQKRSAAMDVEMAKGVKAVLDRTKTETGKLETLPKLQAPKPSAKEAREEFAQRVAMVRAASTADHSLPLVALAAHAPTVTATAAQRSQNATAYLESQVPKPQKWGSKEPSDQEVFQFLETARAVDHPVQTLSGGLAAGTLSKRQVDAIKTTSPSVYDAFKKALDAQLKVALASDRRIPYPVRRDLALLFDEDTDWSMTPAGIAALQQGAQPPAGGNGNGGGPKHGARRKAVETPSSRLLSTEAERLEGGQIR